MRIIATLITALSITTPTWAAGHGQPVGITSTLSSVEITQDGRVFTIERNQDNDAVIVDDYAKTSRPCPPFCVQPMTIAPGVETIGELEMIQMLEQRNFGELDALLIDSRTPDWAAKGMIPGAINVPWDDLVVE
jgi:Rhodanese-related sulfurtransferase